MVFIIFPYLSHNTHHHNCEVRITNNVSLIVRTEGALTGLANVIGSTLVNAFSVANRAAATTTGTLTNPCSSSGAVTGQLSALARSLLVVE
jgi:uncharacterized membrane protein YjfL (UPF0719 family)